MPFADAETNRQRSAARSAAKSAARQDIAARIGPIANPRRRNRAGKSLRAFADAYFPERFPLAWSDDHVTLLRDLERVIRSGGRLRIAMPRGSGKTTLVEVACLWAMLLGLRSFIALIGADRTSAKEMLDSLKSELQNNELLAADFPREALPFALLEGEARRCVGQRCDGRRTHVRWTADTIVFATVPGSKASGAVLRVAGLTGRIRGMKFCRPDGKNLRPDLCVIDDPQTDDSARSDSQTDFRERVLADTIPRLAGPGKRIAVFMPCTVIRRGDLAERLFDPKRHPQWEGERMKALYSFPSDMKLWEEYARLYREARERGVEAKEAGAFYKKNRRAMDAGAKVAWPARFDAGEELSAVQHCMNLFLFQRRAFLSEYQNEPEADAIARSGKLTAEAVLKKLNGRPRGQVPKKCQWIVAHVDVHDEILFYAVLAVEPGFTSHLIDYGTWPGQSQRYFAQDDAPLKMSAVYKGLSKEGTICAGLSELLQKQLMPRRYPRESGGDQPLDLCVVDTGYKPDEVCRVIRAAAQGNRLVPCRGVPIGAARKPFPEYKPEPGQILGRHWRKCVTKSTGLFTLEIDVNRWKSFARDRLAAALGDPGGLEIFGDDPREHQLLADHFCSQSPVAVSGPYGAMEQWQSPPNHPDDHWWDNLVDALAAASSLPAGPKLEEWNRRKPADKSGEKKPETKRRAVAYL